MYRSILDNGTYPDMTGWIDDLTYEDKRSGKSVLRHRFELECALDKNRLINKFNEWNGDIYAIPTWREDIEGVGGRGHDKCIKGFYELNNEEVNELTGECENRNEIIDTEVGNEKQTAFAVAGHGALSKDDLKSLKNIMPPSATIEDVKELVAINKELKGLTTIGSEINTDKIKMIDKIIEMAKHENVELSKEMMDVIMSDEQQSQETITRLMDTVSNTPKLQEEISSLLYNNMFSQRINKLHDPKTVYRLLNGFEVPTPIQQFLLKDYSKMTEYEYKKVLDPLNKYIKKRIPFNETMAHINTFGYSIISGILLNYKDSHPDITKEEILKLGTRMFPLVLSAIKYMIKQLPNAYDRTNRKNTYLFAMPEILKHFSCKSNSEFKTNLLKGVMSDEKGISITDGLIIGLKWNFKF